MSRPSSQRTANRPPPLKGEGLRGAAVREWLGRIGLTGFEHHYPKQLSGGLTEEIRVEAVLAAQGQ